MKPRVRYKAGKLHWITDDDLIKKDIEMEDNARTFMILREIANSIDPDIQWEEDVPSAHPSGMLPCLDMQLWYDKPANKPYHQFYKKSMSSRYLILNKSAVSSTTKRNAIFQEGIRRLMNCSPELEWNIKADHLSLFSHAMMISGYDVKFRLQTID